MTTDDLVRLVREQSQRAEGLPPLPRYDVQARLGEGATAVVYRAWDRDLRRPVALKLLRESAGFSEVGRQRFRREAQAAAGLTHPNVITVHDAGEVEGRLYLVMEIVEGKPLSDSLRNPTLPLQDRVRLIEGAARGVAAAHEKGIVHRDLKPQNVLVAAGGVPKVADFGLAHMVDSTTALTRTGTTLGTPLYMSPEQVEGRSRDITPRTDVWALGAMLYETLAGAPPFVGETQMEIYQKISRHDPAPQQSMPRDLETVALKALEKEPSRRYSSAREFADDLRRYLDGQAIAARRPPRWVRGWKRLSRSRAVIVVTAALLAAGAWIGAHQWRQAAKVRTAMSLAAEDERQGRFQDARDGYRLVRELEPSNAEAFQGLQRTEQELARRRQALLEQARLQEEAVKFMKPAVIESAVGNVLLLGARSREAARSWQNLPSGNSLETVGTESSARIKYLNVVVMELDGETLLQQWLDESGAGGTKAVSLKHGALRVAIPTMLPGKAVVFSTPHLDVQSAPAFFRLIVTPASSRLIVEQGALRATRRSDGASVLVEQGSALECGAKGAMAAQPLCAPGGRLVADFESHAEQDWTPNAQSSKGTFSRTRTQPGLQGTSSLRLQYSIPHTEMGWATQLYPAPQDWSGFSGISFWFNGAKTGTQVLLEVLENFDSNRPGSRNERFWYSFRDDFTGWKKFDVAWEQFKRRDFPDTPNDGFTRKEVWGMTLIMTAYDAARQGVAEFDQIELMGPTPAASTAPWKSIFDGKTLDKFVRQGPATWRIENGALVHDPAVPGRNAMQTTTSFGDAEIRIRFDVLQDLDNIWFAMRQGVGGSYVASWYREDLTALRGRPHELIFVCRGETVAAFLDGKSVPMEVQGRPREGPLQFDASGPGLRIFSIDHRAVR
jgi:serine/threonine-protein kinase